MKKVSLMKKRLIILSMFSVCILYCAQLVSASDLVSGRYLSSSGKVIELSLGINSPPPASLILEQYFPAGMEILNSSPGFQKYSSQKGKAKWLLKGLQAGKMKVRVELARDVAKGEVRAVVRYKNPTSGSMVEFAIVP